MSKKVDTSEPLSADDYRYLRDRGLLPERYELAEAVPEEGLRATSGTDVGHPSELGDEPAEVGDWNVLTVVELRAELDRRGLETSGNKAQLVERLMEYDDDEFEDEDE